MKRKTILGIGICLLLLFIINIFMTPSNLLNQCFNKVNPNLTTQDTGDLKQVTTDFSGWNHTQTVGKNQLLRLAVISLETNVSASAGDCRPGWEGIDGDYKRTLVKDGNVWYMQEKEDNTVVWMRCYFQNPIPARSYNAIKFTNYLACQAAWGESGHISITNRTSHPVLAGTIFTQAVITVPNYDNVVYATYYYTAPCIVDADTNRLGEHWADQVQTVIWRYQTSWFDLQTRWYWDYSRVTFCWNEYASSGIATSPLYNLSDSDHTYKQLHNITFQGSLNGGTIQLFYRVNSPMGWSNWIHTVNGTLITSIALARQAQVRFTLTPNATLNQKSPKITSLTLNYGNPPSASAPIITDVQQYPLPSEVGYKDVVSVACEIETYAPLTQAVINITTDNWLTFALYSMTDSFGYGKSSYEGAIPATPYGSVIQYRIFAQNIGPDDLRRNSTSIEYNYTTIDNVPPNIIHLNSSEWVKPLYPLPTASNVLIECKIEEISALDWVKLNYTIPGTASNNVSIPMDWNATCSRYWCFLLIPEDTFIIYYNIFTQDDKHNLNITPCYSISIDREGPAISSWPSCSSWPNPQEPECDDSVYIFANLTDPNGISSVTMRWSPNTWGDNYTRTMTRWEGDTWYTPLPIPPYHYMTTIRWEIRAKDFGDNWRVVYFAYQVVDRTPPEILNIDYPTPVEEGRPLPINITLREPEGASGIIKENSLLYYKLKSDPLNVRTLFLNNLSRTLWSVVIPAQSFNETVTFWIYLEDYAHNNFTSEEYTYTVIKTASLIDWVNFVWWVFIIIALTGVLLLTRRHTTRMTGSKFVGLGAVGVITVTAIIWMSPLSWLNLENLSFQEWLNQLGGSGNWFSLIFLFFGMFLVFAFSLGVLYSYDRRRTLRTLRGAGIEDALGTVARCLEELEEEL